MGDHFGVQRRLRRSWWPALRCRQLPKSKKTSEVGLSPSSTSAQAVDTLDVMSQARSVSVNVYVKSKCVYSTELTTSLELGRQRPGEAPPFLRIDDRVVVARLEESEFSRRHVTLNLLGDGRIRVANESTVNNIVVGTDDRVEPGEQRDVTAPILVTLGDRVVHLEPAQDEPEGNGIFDSFAHQTLPPGLASHHSMAEMLSVNRSQKDTEYLLRGLHATIGCFQIATTSADFFKMATDALLDVVAMETAAALTLSGEDWNVEAFRSKSLVEADDAVWQPSRTILQRVREEKKTFWQVPDGESLKAASLANVKVLIAAPILNRNAEVIGALYGDHRWDTSSREDPEVTEVEAILVELLSTSIAAGIARLDQEKAAIESRVLFEQFFTPQLSRILEEEPELLVGKDAEVTLLSCDIRRFSQVSETLGARITLDWINDIMGTLSSCIANNQGVVVDTFGDELLGMWGAPDERPDHAQLACRAAIQMLQQLPALNMRWQSVLDQPMDLGIGIHTGRARVGNIGSEHKFKYGPIGLTVQLANRTQRATRSLQIKILVTNATAAKLDESFPMRKLCRVTHKQVEGPMELFELATESSESWLELQRRYEAAYAAFDRGDMPTATKLLAKILTDHPYDHPTLQLVSRINERLSSSWSF